ncbi:zinc finger protein 185 [Mastacembelus armatus]|uniref:zinc finger protein 185 n=1 Tax=Mastacembelus armatus TaxID=205130 RepID=UPI000E460791|nr:zinc finger protein 185-like [Mastacembelus armatus]
MSKDVNRAQVFQATRVRTALKTDASWIHKSKPEKEKQDKAGMECEVNPTPVAVRQKSEVLSMAKKFGNSADQANPLQEDAQPEGSTKEARDDTEPRTSIKKQAENGTVQPEKPVTSKKAVCPVQPAERPAPDTTAVNKGEKVHTSVEQPSVEHSETKVAKTSAVAGTGSSELSAEVPVVLAEPVLKTRVEEVKCEVQPDNTSKQSVKPTPKKADCVMKVSVKDAFQTVINSEGGAAQKKSKSGQAIELTDALDVVLPTTNAAEAAEAPSTTEASTKAGAAEMPPRTDAVKTSPTAKTSEVPPTADITNTLGLRYHPPTEKHTRDGKAVCSFCDQTMDGNVKITLSDPPVICHPDCLKCGVCTKALGDLLTPMFLHNQMIQCDGCFLKAFRT